MSKIGRAIRIPTNFNFSFVLTIDGTEYFIDNKSTSSSVTNKYKYVREAKGWYLDIYTTATIKFTLLKHRIDYFVGGGGAGGGGGYANSWSSGASWGNGGYGGGGYWAELYSQLLTPNASYTLTVGAGGGGGGAGLGASSGNGHAGGASSVKLGSETLLSARGGYGGVGGSGNQTTNPSGAGGTDRFVFGDTDMYHFHGNRGSGGGGGLGYAAPGGYQSASAGSAGVNGIIVIRSAR